VKGTPMYVIQVVFESDPKHLFYVLKNWLFIALISEHHAYEEPDQRKVLLSFYESLLVLIAGLDILNSGASNKECCIYYKNPDPSDDYFEFYLLSKELAANPKQVIETFFNQYTNLYIQREFSDWIETAIDFQGDFPGGITIRHIYSTYKDVLCLADCADC
jgi:hypothetical protein